MTSHRFFAIPVFCFCCPGNDCCCYDDPETTRPLRKTKSNRMTLQKRAVLHMAFGYAGAWLL